jgi:hypothetical protein
MKKRLLTLIFVSVLASGMASVYTTAISHASCYCSCAMVCDNRCEFECSGCGLTEGMAAATRCCQEAHTATGDTAPCLEGGGSF